ncbi:hypothetical protein GKZ89_01415 [Bacillus mangrovi]|uniref:Uncharacterized protein n=1 Tax=Metabacillus mangrovi TaxID=1491830 RepID=A0A7X2V3J2_9BACI|nr:hypothetical protein [Metabacillus mangrovi]MTH52048.1 hypothetical protein [Metabacillus mangrovi]
MAQFSTGPVDNQSGALGRIAQFLTVKAVNRDAVNSGTLLVEGYSIGGSRTLYVQELVSISPNQVLTRNYFADVDTYEFLLTAGGTAEPEMEVSLWGKDSSGNIVSSQRLVFEEFEENS